MIALVILVLLVAVAAWTDVGRHRIFNWNTYLGMLAAPLLNAAGLGLTPHGYDGLAESAAGFFACGFIMLAAFVFFEMGGGDVKLIAMIGAFLGLERGIEVLLWTFSLGFVLGVTLIIWKYGAWNILKRSFEQLCLIVKARGWVALSPFEREPLKRGLFLAPSAFLAILVVIWPVLSSKLIS